MKNEIKNIISTLNSYGYYPIGICFMFFDYTIIFKTEKEANSAFNEFEKNCNDKNKKIVAWWYSLDTFELAKKHYIKLFDTEYDDNKIHWLNDK